MSQPVRRARRHHGCGQDDGRPAARRRPGRDLPRQRPRRRGEGRQDRAGDLRRRRRGRVPGARAGGRRRRARPHDGVLALGGGAVLDASTRALLAGHHVVFLRVGLADAVKRVGLGAGRPLLLGNVRARVKQLLDERTPVYEGLARISVDTDGRSPQDVAAEVVSRIRGERPMTETVLHVGGASPYDVVVGRGLADRLPGDPGQRRAAGGVPLRRRARPARRAGARRLAGGLRRPRARAAVR